MISEKTIRNEKVMGINMRFADWMDETRLNTKERQEIEEIIDDLRDLIDY